MHIDSSNVNFPRKGNLHIQYLRVHRVDQNVQTKARFPLRTLFGHLQGPSRLRNPSQGGRDLSNRPADES